MFVCKYNSYFIFLGFPQFSNFYLFLVGFCTLIFISFLIILSVFSLCFHFNDHLYSSVAYLVSFFFCYVSCLLFSYPSRRYTSVLVFHVASLSALRVLLWPSFLCFNVSPSSTGLSTPFNRLLSLCTVASVSNIQRKNDYFREFYF